jgi:cysteinyl-tRNA synthetase
MFVEKSRSQSKIQNPKSKIAVWLLVFGLLLLMAVACNMPLEDDEGSDDESQRPASDESAGDDWDDSSAAEPDSGGEDSGPAKARSRPATSLAEVKHWLYLIDVNLDSDTVSQIVASEHDMVVLDFISSEADNVDYPMAGTVARLQEAPHPKLVLAYVDIGEAESYRTYWQPDWEVGDPEWIAGDDPDGWEENYPVAYWFDEWREIWLGPDGLLPAIVEAGFDGVYLDWVEAYSDENVLDLAEGDGVDPVQEMIWWVTDIAETGRTLSPGFLVIAQNAAELVEQRDYPSIIDAIAQEQVWFDGGADNEPPGDCPLPRTEADLDTNTYRQSLSRACRRQYDEYPDSTLHVSSEEYLFYLDQAQKAGLVVFTVDYALDPDNVSWIHETSRGLGFVPFVGSRALDGYVPPH